MRSRGKASFSRITNSAEFLVARRELVRAARRTLWALIRDRARTLLRAIARTSLRRRLRDYLHRIPQARLAGLLRSAALAGAVASALVSGTPAQSQDVELPPIDLAAVARGEGGFIVRGEGEPASGATVARAGDVNGDGIDDVIVGGAHCDPNGCESGPVYVVFGKSGGAPVELADAREGRGGFVIRAATVDSLLGPAIAGAGDVNGDGFADLVLGDPYASPGGREYAGETFVVFGKANGDPVELSEVRAGRGGFAIVGNSASEYSGASVAGAGDVDGDGLADILLSAPAATPVLDLETAGESYVVFGKANGDLVELIEVRSGRGGFAIRGSAAYDYAGYSVAGAGDLNGDGLSDLLIGAPYASPLGRDQAGESYVVFGKPDGDPVELGKVRRGQGGFAIRGTAEYDASGASVSGAGDVNGDGIDDVLIGAPYATPQGRYYAGESYVVFGKGDGDPVELSDIRAGRGGFAIRGSPDDASLGSTIAGAGDVNGDGLFDIVVGAPGASPDGRLYAGESLVIFGKTDGGPVELSDVRAGRGGFAIRGSAAGDESGTSIAGAGDLDKDGLADLLIGAPLADPEGRDNAGGDNAGESYVVFGKSDESAVELADIRAGVGGFAMRGGAIESHSDWVPAGAGDVNGDGLADFIVGARAASPQGRVLAGESYVIFGSTVGGALSVADVRRGRSGFAIRGFEAGDSSGSSVAGAGDVNGDGLADLIVGAPLADPEGRENAGESYVVFGKASGDPVELSEVRSGQGGFSIHGGSFVDESGRSVAAAGDVNGDGLADLIVGAPVAYPAGRLGAGEACVVFGKRDRGSVDLAEVRAGVGGFVIRGAAAYDGVGSSIAGARDVNGDGLADIVLGVPLADPAELPRAGESYVVWGKADGTAVDLSDVAAARGGFTILGKSAYDDSGSSVAGVGDLNGDGFADLLIGAPTAAPEGRGAAGESHVVFGKPSGGAVLLSEVQSGRGGFTIRGSAAGDSSGRSVAGAGDVNGDGRADLLIGADGASPEARRSAGESYVVFGRPEAGPVELSDVRSGRGGFAILGSADYDKSGSTVSGAGDLNGDGLDDLLITSALAGARYPFLSGAAYVVFGRGNGTERSRFRRGAVRGDERVVLSDAVNLLGHLFLGAATPPCLDAADADDSGALAITDAIRILGYLFLGGAEPPAPGPTSCGTDPTADGLGCEIPPAGCG
jgi:hypothetical protein